MAQPAVTAPSLRPIKVERAHTPPLPQESLTNAQIAMAQPAVIAPALLPIKVERGTTPPPPQESLTSPVKQLEESRPLSIMTANSIPSEQSQSQPPITAPSPPPIDELRPLSAALSAFYSCYDDLRTHISSIESAIDSLLKSQSPQIASSHNAILSMAPFDEPTSAPSIPIEEKEKEQEMPKPTLPELEYLCKTMCSRGLRKYMVTNLVLANQLREEVPKALKLADNPARLVFECVGRFFLQGSKAYTKDSPMITAREASVLILECFLLAQADDGVSMIDKEVNEESSKAAIAWRRRLFMEGGLANACEIDARGLLMFIGCFGIPSLFKIEDIKNLIRAGNVKEISGVLKRSRVLVTKISDMLDSMIKTPMAVDAVDIAFTFGFEDKLSIQATLTSFLREAKESWKRTKRISQGSLSAVNEANRMQLTALRSVIKCLERHSIDPAKFLPGWQINDKIAALEKDIADFDKKIRDQMINKRTADESVFLMLKNQELKRLRYVDQGLPRRQASVHLDSQRRLLDGVPGHTIRSLASPPLIHGAGVGHGVLAAGISNRISTIASYTGLYGEPPADMAAGLAGNYAQPYSIGGDSDYSERLAAVRAYAGQPPSYGLYRPPLSLEEFPGLPSSSTAVAGAASDLYQFADSITDSETHHAGGGSRQPATSAGPSVLPAQHSSYMY